MRVIDVMHLGRPHVIGCWEVDGVLVWRLDRWGRSVTDLLATLQELDHLGVGFVSLTEALDLTTPAGRAMAAMLAVFAAFEREVGSFLAFRGQPEQLCQAVHHVPASIAPDPTPRPRPGRRHGFQFPTCSPACKRRD